MMKYLQLILRPLPLLTIFTFLCLPLISFSQEDALSPLPGDSGAETSTLPSIFPDKGPNAPPSIEPASPIMNPVVETQNSKTENEIKANEVTPDAPTINAPDDYEAARIKQRHEMRTPHWAFQLWVSPFAHKRTEWRAAPYSKSYDVKNAKMLDIILQGEKFLLRKHGMLSIGANVELIGQRANDDFEKTFPALYGVGVVSQYQFHYIHGQWVVPFIELGLTELRYNYLFVGTPIRGFKTMVHADVGLSIFLNFLEPSSAGDMFGNYGVRRTYLNASIGVKRDMQNSHNFDLSEENFKVGIRFEF